jgi:hypothetical protein
MIPKMSSAELNNIMLQSKEDIKTVNDKIDAIKGDIDKKLVIINYENQYVNQKIQEISTSLVQPVAGFKAFAKGSTGAFDVYGYTVHPRFLRAPLNVFNIALTNNKIFFRDDASVTMNSIYADKTIADTSDSYKSVLMHDSLSDKEIFFKEFDTQNISITINADTENPLGPTLFNTIELDSFLPGSYDITDITFSYYDINGTEVTDKSLKDMLYEYRGVPAQEVMIKRAGQSRLILPQKVSLKDITFKIKLNYGFSKAGKTVYPFGLKHLYFYDADYNMSITAGDTTAYGSYIITTVTSGSYINLISDSITMKNTIGDIDSTLTAEKIEVYLDYIDGVLDTPVYPGDEIPRNTNNLYVKIPLVKLEANIGIVFNIENR